MFRDVLAVILAGGKGTRLDPLTRHRAKPGVPFGGQYRIIDFTLSNAINSGLRRILVLTQYKAKSLNQHLERGWQFLSQPLGEFIQVLPPEQRITESWYQGTADAIYQNVYTIEQSDPELTLILGGDHIYKMNYAKLIEYHRQNRSDLTIACQPVLLDEASSFGIMEIDPIGTVTGFLEKPARADPMPDDPDRALASMGIYVFRTEVMYEVLFADATREHSAHDFGKDIIPAMLTDGHSRVFAYPFRDEQSGRPHYWRDVGTLDAYYQAHLDLVGAQPTLDLYDPHWPILTHMPIQPPPKIVATTSGQIGTVHDAILCPGVVVSGAQIGRSVLSPGVRVGPGAIVEESVIMDRVTIEPGARVRRAILDKGVHVPAGYELGDDPERDHRRGFTVSDEGITVVPRDEDLTPGD